MMLGSNLKPILEQIEKEKGIPSEELFTMMENALQSAFLKHAPDMGLNPEAVIDRESGKIKLFVEKVVVETPKNANTEIDKVSAMKFNPSSKIGDTVKVEIPADKFGRIAAQTAKQIILQKIRENERENIYSSFKTKEGEIVTGTVYRFTPNACIVEIGKAEAILPEREQIGKQKLMRGDSIKLYVVEVKMSSKGPKILVSRSHPGLVAGLFKLEVPEVADGVVEIMKIVRDPGIRCKVAVVTHNPRVDPIGACVGINGVRVQSVINELGGERIDLIKYSENILEFIANSLSPAEAKNVSILDEENREARVVVADDMLSLAIGKNGQNVRLAARLTNWHIDIQSETQMSELKKNEAEQKIAEKSQSRISEIQGIGEKIMTVLKENGLDTVEKIRESGSAGLEKLPGIGPKTAEKILKAIENGE